MVVPFNDTAEPSPFRNLTLTSQSVPLAKEDCSADATALGVSGTECGNGIIKRYTRFKFAGFQTISETTDLLFPRGETPSAMKLNCCFVLVKQRSLS